jgi:hypothetical protein
MGFLDRILGRSSHEPAPHPPPAPPQYGAGQGPGSAEDQRAIARYRYLLRTAPPDQVEQAHLEAFSRLTPDQREQVLSELSRELPAGERLSTSEPAAMARAATRAEMRDPGFMERTLGAQRRGGMGGIGVGGMFAGSMLGTIAGVVVGSAIAESLFDGYAESPEAQEDPTTAEGGDGSGSEAADTSGQDATGAGGDYGGGDYGGSDYGGGDVAGGDVGGGFGGGDFGGGDFGGGDFGL